MRAFPIIASLAALFILAIANVGPALRAEVSPPAAGAHYTPLPDRAVIPPTMACADLPKRDFLSLKGAPSRISSAELVKGESGEEFCFVKGMIAPQIQFELHLPTKSYTGRYLQGGCGGACGVIYKTVSPSCDNRVAFGGQFAVGFNNSGHVGPEIWDKVWSAYSAQARADYAYRAAHVSAVVAKEILAAYYGRKPDFSYFMGCSGGGREALMEAQRYPEDFDGIIAGSPAIWVTPSVTRIIFESQIAQDEQGNQILTPQSSEILHKAVMAACDGLDGLKDGQIDNPRACTFDPGRLQCQARQTDNCLTERQVAVMRQLYRGPVDSEGKHLYPGGEPYGSELQWAGPASFTAKGYTVAANQIKFMIYGGETHQDFNWRSWHPDKAALADLMDKGGFYNASQTDLSPFKRAGGKLIMWQGEADNVSGSYFLLDYYQRVRDRMGGFAATDPFLRVYMMPGMYHCSGGYVPYEHDLLGPMVNWVEKGTPPQGIVGTASLPDQKVRRRPVYPYPFEARYKGKGDVNSAESFAPARPRQEPNDRYNWLGADLPSGPDPTPH